MELVSRRTLFGLVPAAALVPALALAATSADEWAQLEAFLTFAHPDGAAVMEQVRKAAKRDWNEWVHAYDPAQLRDAMKPDMVRGITFTSFDSGDGLTVLFSTAPAGDRHPNVIVTKQEARARCGGVWFA